MTAFSMLPAFNQLPLVALFDKFALLYIPIAYLVVVSICMQMPILRLHLICPPVHFIQSLLQLLPPVLPRVRAQPPYRFG